AYAIARSAALWGNESAAEARARFDSAYKLVRAAGGDRNASRAEKLRAALERIVRTLLSFGPSRPLTYELRPVAEALQQLERARSSRYMKEAERFVQPLLGHAPEAIKLRSLSELAPEARLRLFDETIGALKESRQDPVRRVVL